MKIYVSSAAAGWLMRMGNAFVDGCRAKNGKKKLRREQLKIVISRTHIYWPRRTFSPASARSPTLPDVAGATAFPPAAIMLAILFSTEPALSAGCLFTRTHSHTHTCARLGAVLLLRLRKTLQLAGRNAGRKMTASLLWESPVGVRCRFVSRQPVVLLGNGAAVLRRFICNRSGSYKEKRVEKRFPFSSSCFRFTSIRAFYPSPGRVSKDDDVFLPVFFRLLPDGGCDPEDGGIGGITISATCRPTKTKTYATAAQAHTQRSTVERTHYHAYERHLTNTN